MGLGESTTNRQDQVQLAKAVLGNPRCRWTDEVNSPNWMYQAYGNMVIYEKYTLWLFNIAMENGTFIDDFPIKTTIYRGFSMAILNIQMVWEIYGNLVN